MIWTMKVTCIAGPYHDEECARFIEVGEHASLYDLHVAIQDAVHFDDEYEFAYFHAASPRDKRSYVPEGVDPRNGVDTDLYEDVALSQAISTSARRKLFYLFNPQNEWIFELHQEPGTKAPSPHEFYPRVRDDRNVGPDPMQYGNDPDDYSAVDDLPDLTGLPSARRPIRDDGDDGDDRDDEEALSIHSAMGSFGDEEDHEEEAFGDEDDGDRW